MNILFYTPFYGRSRDTESLMIQFKEEGHSVYYLSQNHGSEIEKLLYNNDIKVYNSPIGNKNSIIGTLKEVFFLIRFCHKYRINILFSHLEPCNFIAVLAQYFIKAKVIICRHHIDEMHLIKKDKLLSYRLTYKLGKRFIVVSERSKDYMINVEKVSADKINVINLSYNFQLYDKVNIENTKNIRKEFNCDLLLITACRMITNKRPDLSINLVEELVKKNINVKLLLLGNGDMTNKLKEVIIEKDLENNCFLLGRKNAVLEYLSAADILIHPSIIDSSSVIVKEAGLVKKTAIVCREVGDFSDYIKNGKNGILVSKENYVNEAADFIINTYMNQNKWKNMGEELHASVMDQFSIEKNYPLYKKHLM